MNIHLLPLIQASHNIQNYYWSRPILGRIIVRLGEEAGVHCVFQHDATTNPVTATISGAAFKNGVRQSIFRSYQSGTEEFKNIVSLCNAVSRYLVDEQNRRFQEQQYANLIMNSKSLIQQYVY